MEMTRWERTKAIVGATLDLPPDEREAAARQACGADAALLADVLSLLAQSADTGLFALPVHDAEADQHSHWLGRRLGPYTIVRELVSGGMGRVFEARRSDGEYDSRVAIKILRASLDTGQVRLRFATERQILAQLHHPHIATLLDGGTIDELPYFVMEYVDGVPIDRYCSEQQLGIRAKVGLLMQVCGAVEFAHQQLVVHRDLKPDNILVMADGTPKLLDFGIAKLLAADADDRHTRDAGTAPYTPAYAAPEQLLGEPITTGTDVYALGCVLYRLLTGKLPFDSAIEPPATLRERQPQRPSAVLPHGAIDTDLELIVMMALRSDLSLRYKTVAEFHADLARYLGNQPVTARRPSLRYVSAKFIRRHRAALAGATLALTAVLAGAGVALWQAHVANTMRASADARLADVATLSQKMIFDYNEKIEPLPGAMSVSQLLMRDVAQMLDRLNQEASLPPQMQLDLALAYQRLAATEGGYRRDNTGDIDLAAEHRNKSYALLNQLLRAGERQPGLYPLRDPDNTRISRRNLLLYTSYVDRDLHDEEQRLAHFDRARAHIERAMQLVRLGAQLSPSEYEEANITAKLAQFYAHHDGRHADALILVRHAQALTRKALAAAPDDLLTRALLAKVLTAEALYLQDSNGDPALTEQAFERGIEQDRLLLMAAPDNVNYRQVLASDLFRLGSIDLLNAKLEPGHLLLEEAASTLKPLLSNQADSIYLNYVYAMIVQGQGEYWLRTGQLEQAARVLAEMKTLSISLNAADGQSYDHQYYAAVVHGASARLLAQQHQQAAADAAIARADQQLRPIARRDQGMARRLAGILFRYADTLAEIGQWDAARRAYQPLSAGVAELAGKAGSDAYRRYQAHLALGLARTMTGLAQQAPAGERATLQARSRQHYQEIIGQLGPVEAAGRANPLDRQWLRLARTGAGTF